LQLVSVAPLASPLPQVSAMPAMKRPAAASGVASAAKKGRRTADPDLAKYDSIAAVVRDADGYPSGIKAMLASAVKVSLAAPRDLRHGFAESMVAMMEEVLKSVEASVRQKVAELELKVGESDQEKAVREAAVDSTTASCAVLTEALEGAKAKLTAANEEHAKAKAALQAAEAAQKSGDEALHAAADRKAQLEAVSTGDFALVKETTSPKLLKAFLKAVQGFGFDAHLVKAAESTFAKAAGDKGMFDGLVVTELDAAFAAALAAVGEELASGEPAKAERAASVEAARAEAAAKAEVEQALKAKLCETQAVLSAAVGAKKAAEKAAKDFGPEMKKASADLAAADKELAERLAVLATFEVLAARTMPPPPEPEAPPAEESPAEEKAEGEAPPVEAPPVEGDAVMAEATA